MWDLWNSCPLRKNAIITFLDSVRSFIKLLVLIVENTWDCQSPNLPRPRLEKQACHNIGFHCPVITFNQSTWESMWRRLWKRGISDDFGCFIFLLQISWIFACGLLFSWKTFPCNFFRWVALRFREITYAKKGTFPSGIFLSNAKQKKPFVSLDNEINEASH